MEMLSKSRKIVRAAIIMCLLAISGCAKNDGALDVGLYLVSIPQANFSGGVNNHYPVPGGSGEFATVNHEVAGNNLNVLLGVARSGSIAKPQGFTVDVTASEAASASAIASDEIENGVVLPSDMYTLPSEVTVPAGSHGAPFRLAVDISKLGNSAYDGKKLVLAVSIANPTAYTIAEDNTTVVVIIDVDAIREVL